MQPVVAPAAAKRPAPNLYAAIIAAMTRFLPRDFCGPADQPFTPVEALPRTEQKIFEMRRRYRLRQELFHPDDARPRQTRATPERLRNGRDRFLRIAAATTPPAAAA
jgi:hypothetical protein